MSSHPGSRGCASPDPTLADVLAAVQAADLTERRRQEISSAVRTIARAIGKPPERIPSHPRLLGERLKQVAPHAIGISPGRWNNVRSLARAGLSLVRQMSPGRHTNEVSPRWQELVEQLHARPAKMSLSRFLRFCSARAIEPEAVTTETFDEFRNHLDNTLLARPEAVFAETARGWRAAQAIVESWPGIAVSVPDRRKIWTLPWTTFPKSLRTDFETWSNRLTGRDLLDEMPFRPVGPVTLALRERQTRAFASALVLRGRDPATITSLRDLVEIEAFKMGLRFLLERGGGKPTKAIANLATGLKAIARHQVRVDSAHLDRMGSIIRRLDTNRGGLTETNRARLRPLEDPRNVTALLKLPAKLMTIAVRTPHPRLSAIQAQLAIAIEILLMAPIRIGNLAKLDLDRNLVCSSCGKALHIVIEAEAVKNRQPLEYPLPAQSIELLKRYIREFRPRLAPATSTALFPGEGGRAKARHTLGEQITKVIHLHTGMRMHPHLFRHATAKLFLDANPGGLEVVRRVLGHRSSDTTISYYTGMETAAAVRHFDETILQLRKSSSGK
jgi:integrase